MSEVVRGDTGQTEEGSIDTYLEGQAQEFGEDDLDIDAVLEGTQVQESGQSSREGTDVVLARLDESDPAAAEALRGMQRRMSQNNNEWHDLRTEVLGLREQMLAQREQAVQQPEPVREEEPLLKASQSRIWKSLRLWLIVLVIFLVRNLTKGSRPKLRNKLPKMLSMRI